MIPDSTEIHRYVEEGNKSLGFYKSVEVQSLEARKIVWDEGSVVKCKGDETPGPLCHFFLTREEESCKAQTLQGKINNQQ